MKDFSARSVILSSFFYEICVVSNITKVPIILNTENLIARSFKVFVKDGGGLKEKFYKLLMRGGMLLSQSKIIF
jgi:hypothetical protein